MPLLVPLRPPKCVRLAALSSYLSPRRSFWTRRETAMAPKTDASEFRDLLKDSTRVLAVCGAGLSASSGLPTFRGPGGLWRNHEPTELATPEAFQADPALV